MRYKNNLINFILICSLSFICAQTQSQINQAKNYIKSTGMTEPEVRAAAKSRGYSDKEINKVIDNQKNPENFKSSDESLNVNKSTEGNLINSPIQESLTNTDLSTTSQKDNDNNQEIMEKSHSNISATNTPTAYFGYDIFQRDPSLFQSASVGAVDPEYLIGPNDEIIVTLWGETQFRQLFTVNREGFIFIPEIGQVFVNGLNLNLLESKLFRVLSQSYASLNPQNRKATTFLDVSLGNLRPLRIQVLGQVAQPGAYTVSPMVSLFSSLYYFNGPTVKGSLRDIRLIRGDENFATIDFYDYLLTGKKPKDVKLQLDDVVFIPKRMKTISIEGQINRPGIYEMKPGETLLDLISFAGDLRNTAFIGYGQIDRIVPFDQRLEIGMDRMYIDINLSDLINQKNVFDIQDGDRVKIYSISEIRQNAVMITGAVSRPGQYQLGDSLRLSDLIIKANGLLGDPYLERVDIIRTNKDYTEELIKLNLSKALDGDSDHNILLTGLDKVHVYSITSMISESYVSISGHVKQAGRFPLQSNMLLYDLIFKSGGFVDNEFKKRTHLDRADLIRYDSSGINQIVIPFNLGKLLESKESEYNYSLMPGDEVKIYSKQMFNGIETLTIKGSVKNPGLYNYKNNMTIQDLILEAGGFSSNVHRYMIEVARIDPSFLDENTYAQSFSINMKNDYSLDYSSQNSDKKAFQLMPFDFISIKPDPFFNIQKTVRVSGAVYYPGEFVILSPNETISEIIKRAGGFRLNAYAAGSRFTRKGQNIQIDLEKIIDRPSSKYNIPVQSGDEIIIIESPNLIQVLGQVSAPGFYKFTPGVRLKGAINQAGGFSQDAEKSDIFIKFPNGRSKKYSPWFSNPKVLDGSIITVGKKPEEEPFDRTEYAKEITTILANLAQAISLILLARG